MNTAIYPQERQWQPRARWTVLMRGPAPRAVMAAAVGLLMGLPAPVIYAHGGDASLIHACVKKIGGKARIVGPSASCAADQTAVDWSITGPRGPAGLLSNLDALHDLPCDESATDGRVRLISQEDLTVQIRCAPTTAHVLVTPKKVESSDLSAFLVTFRNVGLALLTLSNFRVEQPDTLGGPALLGANTCLAPVPYEGTCTVRVETPNILGLRVKGVLRWDAPEATGDTTEVPFNITFTSGGPTGGL